MPVYEYECPACEKVFEMQQRMSDAPLTVCPDCEGKVKKIVSMSSFHLKGGGWYSDGYSSRADSDDGKTGGSSDGKTKPAKDAKDTKDTRDAKAMPPCKGGASKSCEKCPAAT